MSLLRRLFHRRPEPSREHSGAFTGIDRNGCGWIMCSLPRPHVRVARRIVRRRRLRQGDRVEFDVDGAGYARRLQVTRRAAA